MLSNESMNQIKDIAHDIEHDINYLGMKKELISYRLNIVVNITPELAATLLANNINNRSLNNGRVSFYAKQIRNNNWRLTGETIKLAKNYTLIDGQHRLEAIIKAGKSAEMEIAFGIDNDTFNVIDTGRTRNGADVISILKVKNAAKVASVLRTLIAYQRGVLIGTRGGRTNLAQYSSKQSLGEKYIITNADIEQAYYDNPGVEDYIGKSNKNLGFETAYSFIFYVLSTSRYKEKAKEFIEYINSGELKKGDRFYRDDMMLNLREFLISKNLNKGGKLDKLSSREIIGYCFKAFNYYVNDRVVKKVRYSLSEGIPQ
ncbi:MAG: hypothetical protein KIT33_15850, partial [Candidatus Kapabacteria bacterium]|nr:hypothetical protein [Candidatus Kapabacteria bacterium]